jgi:hypothetical protein
MLYAVLRNLDPIIRIQSCSKILDLDPHIKLIRSATLATGPKLYYKYWIRIRIRNRIERMQISKPSVTTLLQAYCTVRTAPSGLL